MGNFEKNYGITLIALVITIVILIILATVTINVAFGDGGLIQKTLDAKNLTEQAVAKEEEELNYLISEFGNIMEEDDTSVEPDEPEQEEPEKSEIQIAKEDGTIFSEKTDVKDEKGNNVVVPEGFKIAEESGDTVQQGIVIEDASSTDANVKGSQYVWIPLGKFIKDDGKESSNIILGRYTFLDDEYGTPKLEQAAYTDDNLLNYKTEKIINTYFSEVPEYKVGVATTASNGRNTSAYELSEWINSARENEGYYIGRYEASYASGDSTNLATCKVATKKSTNFSEDSMSYKEGTLWNYISQLDASKVSINTYKDSSNGVKSDLVNSYAWDTTIVFLQEAGQKNYANEISANSTINNTGTTGDEVCKINDMASNLLEWTTEYSNRLNYYAYPCTTRGGGYGLDIYCASSRYSTYATDNSYYYSFRITLYF